MSLSDLRIQTKLLLGFGLVLALLIAVSAFALIQLRKVAAQSTVISERWMPSVYAIEEKRLGAAGYRRQQYAHLSAPDDKVMDKYEGEMAKALAVFAAGQKIYDPLPQTEEEAQVYKQCLVDWQAYQGFTPQWLALSRGGKKDDARILLMSGAMRDVYYKVDTAMNKIIAI